MYVCVCADMGAGLYATSKSIADSDLSPSFTPEMNTPLERAVKKTGKNMPSKFFLYNYFLQ